MAPTITLCLPSHRNACLCEADPGDAAAYDAHIDDYIAFLAAELAAEGITLETTPETRFFTEHVAADSLTEEDGARLALSRVDDFWQWYS